MKEVKKYVLLGCLTILFISCKNNEERIKLEAISILVENQHPFLMDHSRILFVKNSKSKEIDREELHIDVDGNTPAYLFEDNNNYILIDADGRWYYIDKATGKVKKDDEYDPFVRKKLPKNYIGTFIFNQKKNEYDLKMRKAINESIMYKFGGGTL